MNKADRKKVAALKAKLEDLQNEAARIGEEIQELADAEREKFDNMPEGLQQSESGQKIEQAADALAEAAASEDIQQTIDALDSIGE